MPPSTAIIKPFPNTSSALHQGIIKVLSQDLDQDQREGIFKKYGQSLKPVFHLANLYARTEKKAA